MQRALLWISWVELIVSIVQMLAYGTGVLTILGKISCFDIAVAMLTFFVVASAGVGRHIWAPSVDPAQVFKVSQQPQNCSITKCIPFNEIALLTISRYSTSGDTSSSTAPS